MNYIQIIFTLVMGLNFIPVNGQDTIVVSTGMKSYIPFKPEFKIPVYYIGDARETGNAQSAIYDDFKLALTL